MRVSGTRLQPIGEDEAIPAFAAVPVPDTPASSSQQTNIATEMLVTALRGLSQRAIVALANLYAILLAASAFWLWLMVLPEPTVLQLVGVGMYAVFVLAMLALKSRR